jgi:SAM-dependent methyltransferase
MASMEEKHWWYRGLRDMLARTLNQPRFALPAAPRVLDAGCGTGRNLQFLQEHLRPSYLAGFDLSPVALSFARQHARDADLYLGDLRQPEVRRKDLDLILSCDVLQITGVPAALEGLRRLVAHLRPGGLFVVNLPATKWLRGEHDLTVHTNYRFDRRDLRDLFAALGLRVELLSYRLCALFPAIVLARLPGMLRTSKPRPEEAKSDLAMPGALVNRLLESVVTAENAAVALGVPLPWGSSVFAVGRKPTSAAPGAREAPMPLGKTA